MFKIRKRKIFRVRGGVELRVVLTKLFGVECYVGFYSLV